MVSQELRQPAASGVKELVATVRAIIWKDWGNDTIGNGPEADEPSGAFIIGVVDSVTGVELSVKGHCVADEIEVGMAYRFLGKSSTHPKYGKQFIATTFVKHEPANRAGVVRYLAKICPHIGDARAELLWNAFGSKAVETLRLDPQAVVSRRILTDIQASEAADVLAKFSDLEHTKIDLYSLFDRRGFHASLITACIGRWGAKAGAYIRANPFGLLVGEMPSCGFKRVDKLYTDLGHNPARLKRQMLAGWHALREDGTGHTWFSLGFVHDAIRKVIAHSKCDPKKAVKLGINAGWLTTRTDASGQVWVGEADKVRNEKLIGDIIRRDVRRGKDSALWEPAPSDIDCEPPLSEHQRATLTKCLHSPVAILAGTPGTGKTFTAAQVCRWIADRFGERSLAVCAPTGKAAVRVTEAMRGYGLTIQASTIHRLLGLNKSKKARRGQSMAFTHGPTDPLNYGFVIVDESSMLDTDICAALIAACQPGTHLLFVGDPYQLPPVGHGAPLRDMIAAGVPCGELTEIRRNAGMIVHACAAIKDGNRFETCAKFDADAGLNFRHIEAETPVAAADWCKKVLAKFGESGRFNPAWQCQVLVAVNSKSLTSRNEMNRILQPLLNPLGEGCQHNAFRTGDKIICLKNNSSIPVVQLVDEAAPASVNSYASSCTESDFIANGEIGKVLAVAPKVTIAQFWSPDRIVKIANAATKEATNGENHERNLFGETMDSGNGEREAVTATGCDFDLAYACTCHKLQGSESPVVIVMVDESGGAKRVCCREWVYTAISRASKLCVTIGRRAILDQHCRRVSLVRRKTFLKEMLQQEGD